MVINTTSNTSTIPNRGVINLYHLLIGTPIRPQPRAQEVGQNISAKPFPNWYASTAICLLSQINSAVGAIIGMVMVAWLEEPVIKNLIIFCKNSIP